MKPYAATRLFSLSLATCFILSACGAGQFLGPTLTPTPTSTNTPTSTSTSTASPSPTITQTPVPVPFGILGEWKNQSSDPMIDVSRITINFDGSAYTVEIWAPCRPTDCYWNNPMYESSYAVSNITDDSMTITWNTPVNSTVDTFNLEILTDGRLQMEIHEVCGICIEPTYDYTYYFMKISP